MIYTDGIHLISDKSLEELHRFAQAVGIGHWWFHKGSRYPHYDIPKKQRGEGFAIRYGIKHVSSREIVRLLKNKKPV